MPGIPIVLLVHGMGTHRASEAPKDVNIPNITEDFVAGVNEAAKNFGFANYDISTKLEIHEFNYSNYFDDIRAKLAGDDSDDKSFESLRAKGVTPAVVDWLLGFESDVTKDEMLYTHWLDVVLYAFPQFGEPIRIMLATKINQLFRDSHPRDIHLICHSLGTAVVHDTLAKIYRKDADILDKVPDFKPGEFNLKTLWTFANVSRMVNILYKVDDPNNSLVKSGPGGCADYFYNIRHEFDPFTWFKKFDRQMPDSETIENEIIRVLNTHDFKEYVTDPVVAKALLAELDDSIDIVTQPILDIAKKEHLKGSLNLDYDALRAAIDSIKADDHDSCLKVFEAYNILKKSIEDLINNAT